MQHILDCPVICPYCTKELQASTHIAGEDFVPQPGDITICFHCAGVSRYTEKLELEACGDLDEIDGLDAFEKARIREACDVIKQHVMN